MASELQGSKCWLQLRVSRSWQCLENSQKKKQETWGGQFNVWNEAPGLSSPQSPHPQPAKSC